MTTTMNQFQLDNAIARATGESRSTIARMGFSIADPESVHYDPEPSHQRRPRIKDRDSHARQKFLY